MKPVLAWLVEHRLVAWLLGLLVLLAGLRAQPFVPRIPGLPLDPVAVDALPDLGENQQIVFTDWPGRSPRDVEEQITAPLSSALLGLARVRSVRGTSMPGFSTIAVVFEDGADFYASRTRIAERLASLPMDLLPPGVRPSLGPDATGLGQVFAYTLEGQDAQGRTVGGFDPDELRAVQDWTVRLGLQSVPGVSEVAAVGGMVREVQVDVEPERLRAAGVGVEELAEAIETSNLDVGLRSLERNGVELQVRSEGFLESLQDLEQAVVAWREGAPLRVGDLARVRLGPALRQGALDDEGAPAVGGIVVARHGANPMEVIAALKARIAELEPSLPRRVLSDGTEARVRVVPFYDRSQLIAETLRTLSQALLQQVLITVIVVLVMLRNLRGSLLIAGLLPLSVLGCFAVMKLAGVQANVMALAGIAVAIGTMVDIGIVVVENMHRALRPGMDAPARARAVVEAAAEVGPAVLTSVLTTVVSFLPVLGLTAGEQRLFLPLVLTKSFAMLLALGLALLVLPGLGALLLRARDERATAQRGALGGRTRGRIDALLVLVLGLLLVLSWLPLGEERGLPLNLLVAGLLLVLVLGGLRLFERAYPRILSLALAHKAAFLALPLGLVLLALLALRDLGREYLPPFDEGAFLYMPTTAPHASIGEAQALLSAMDAEIARVPEVARVVGKLGRAESALDPAPVAMFETVVLLRPEFGADAQGRRVRQWRPEIRGPRDIWREIERAATLPGLTGAPRLAPIQARQVMLQSGMRAPLGVKVQGPRLEEVEAFALAVEERLRAVPELRPGSVFADRQLGLPTLSIRLDREALARHGLRLTEVQRTLELALAGVELTRTVEGRQRVPVRLRYAREARGAVEDVGAVLISTPNGAQLPLRAVARLVEERGPQMIRSEDTALQSQVVFDAAPGVDERRAVQAAARAIEEGLREGALVQPEGVSFRFAGTWEQALRAEERLAVLVPLAGLLVFLLIYLQFGRVSTAGIIASGVLVAGSGAVLLLWLYGRPGFLALEVGGVDLRELFQVGTVNLSVAVWVGMIALLGIATDDGVVLSTWLEQSLRARPPRSREEVRARTLEAGERRLRACLMTSATTLLALLPVITSPGRGADVMLPLALPALGGMSVALLTLFVVPVLTAAREERGLPERV